MKQVKSNPLTILRELDALLVSGGYEEDRPARKTIATLRGVLKQKGYEEVVVLSPPSNYTVVRAQALRDLSTRLRKTLHQYTQEGVSYTDRAYALATVSNSYLQLAHAFKVDAKVWSFAQEDLVPVLVRAVDEGSIDTAVSRLFNHLDRYLVSLEKWLGK